MSIASSLFTDSQTRLFVWLFGQPDRSYHLSELRRLTGLGSASLQRELNRLASSGLVDTARVGNLRRFQANPQSPVFNELVGLVRKTLGMDALLREALQPLQPGLKTAWIYGSDAKQTETASSDIDLMLVGENLRLGDVLECVIPLETPLGRKINPTLYTPAEFEQRLAEPDSFVNRVLAQPLIYLIGQANDSVRAG
jgi:predicted nucleotidyltransferase